MYTALVIALHSCIVHPCHMVPHCPLPHFCRYHPIFEVPSCLPPWVCPFSLYSQRRCRKVGLRQNLGTITVYILVAPQFLITRLPFRYGLFFRCLYSLYAYVPTAVQAFSLSWSLSHRQSLPAATGLPLVTCSLL